MRSRLALLTLIALAMATALPAAAESEGVLPPVPDGWTTNYSTSGPFGGNNPCTGDPYETSIERWDYELDHTDGFTRLTFHRIETSDGWSSNGWHRGRTSTEIAPDGNTVVTTVYTVPLYEEDGNGVMIGRQSTTRVILADGTEVVNNHSGFEISCVTG